MTTEDIIVERAAKMAYEASLGGKVEEEFRWDIMRETQKEHWRQRARESVTRDLFSRPTYIIRDDGTDITEWYDGDNPIRFDNLEAAKKRAHQEVLTADECEQVEICEVFERSVMTLRTEKRVIERMVGANGELI